MNWNLENDKEARSNQVGYEEAQLTDLRRVGVGNTGGSN